MPRSGAARSGIGTVLHGALLVWVVAGHRKRSRTLPRDTKICRSGCPGRRHITLESLRPRVSAAHWGTRGGESELCERLQPKAESVRNMFGPKLW
ncbi:hypothetical protein EDB89DRAFT_1971045 [Lactarius sanguifluus]|nr:hypothetical protein EDB89DRAFT_2007929 [Lactarius sanguifluus]KAH9171618.1 hypothetical protein EDB89DRAFT_1971045 [Lactarius sanguifluus]